MPSPTIYHQTGDQSKEPSKSHAVTLHHRDRWVMPADHIANVGECHITTLMTPTLPKIPSIIDTLGRPKVLPRFAELPEYKPRGRQILPPNRHLRTSDFLTHYVHPFGAKSATIANVP